MRYRIVCTDQVPAGNPPNCARIVSVGVSDGGDTGQEQLIVQKVVERMKQGHTFYTFGEESRKTAEVIKYWCVRCSKEHIKSSPDAVHDNNLDFLRYCKWKKAA